MPDDSESHVKPNQPDYDDRKQQAEFGCGTVIVFIVLVMLGGYALRQIWGYIQDWF